MITAAVWAALFVGVGYLYGAAAERMLHSFEGFELSLLGVLIAAGLTYHLVAGRVHRHWRRDDDA